MADTHDPTDHFRTTHRHAGESFIDIYCWPGLLSIALGVMSLMGSVAAAAYQHHEWVLTTGIVGAFDATLVVLTSSRDELIVTLSSLYHIPGYRDKIVGMAIAGHVPISEITQQILDDSNIPYVRVHETTSKVFTTLMDDVAKITVEDVEKINWIKANAENEIDFETIDALL